MASDHNISILPIRIRGRYCFKIWLNDEVFDMQMTEEEICKRFKRNGCYKGHIPILAQLNAVDVIVIEKILRKNGLYDNRRTMRNTR